MASTCIHISFFPSQARALVWSHISRPAAYATGLAELAPVSGDPSWRWSWLCFTDPLRKLHPECLTSSQFMALSRSCKDFFKTPFFLGYTVLPVLIMGVIFSPLNGLFFSFLVKSANFFGIMCALSTIFLWFRYSGDTPTTTMSGKWFWFLETNLFRRWWLTMMLLSGA